MEEAKKETAAQRVERLKREKNAWECMDEIRGFARNGFDSIPPEWLGTYFRAWGVYTQGDGAGAVGGVGGQGKAVPYFMVRIRISNGFLNSEQAHAIADLVDKYGRGVADITVRQNIQLHWVTIESLPEVFESLWRVGLTTVGACGDVTRNIIGCPVAGVDRDAICDASPLVEEASKLFVGNGEFYNLPRKFKIAITGCRVWCSYPEINDIGLTAITRKRRTGEEVGFSLRVGGGLSTDPLFGQRLNAFVRWNQVLPVLKGVAEVFRDSNSLRENRERARLKFLFLRQGWNIDTFLAALEERLGYRLDEAEPEEAPVDVLRDHVGYHEQIQPGLGYIGASVLRGRITGAQLRTAAEVTERYGSGELRTTTMQNLVLLNIPKTNVGAVSDRLTLSGLPTEGSVFQRGTIVCTGSEFCKLAITETKGFARWLTEELDERLPGFEQQLRLHITGCPNSCGQHWIADLGIEGKKLKVDGQLKDAYYFCVGGGVGKFQAFARPVGYRCLASEVPEAIERLLTQFELLRDDQENLRQFLHRHDTDDIRSFLAGTVISAVERDLPSGTVPHGVEG
jgi:sulfite reductase (ferredoxin)